MPLALVVGPSGAGKDTLIAEGRAALGADRRFVFVRRVVTRPAIARLEDHDAIDDARFAAASRRGAFALEWRAHGLSYGIPATIDVDLAAGRVVVANGSRHAIPRAFAKYPDSIAIVVTAEPHIRAARLAERGRETSDEIAARLARDGASLPAGLKHATIDNSGALADGVSAFVATLSEVASAALNARLTRGM